MIETISILSKFQMGIAYQESEISRNLVRGHSGVSRISQWPLNKVTAKM